MRPYGWTGSAAIAKQPLSTPTPSFPKAQRASSFLVQTVLGHGFCHVCTWGHYIIKYSIIPCQITFEPLLILPWGYYTASLSNGTAPWKKLHYFMLFTPTASLTAAARRCRARGHANNTSSCPFAKTSRRSISLCVWDASVGKVKAQRRYVNRRWRI